MNIVNELDDHALGYWSDHSPSIVTMQAPAGMPNCSPCSAVRTMTPDGLVVRVAWRPTPEDIRALASGGVVWLSTWGGLPPHQLEVQEPAEVAPVNVGFNPDKPALLIGFEMQSDVDLTDETVAAFVGSVMNVAIFSHPVGKLRITAARRRDDRRAWINGEIVAPA